MKATACGVSHKGNVRSHNEDNLFLNGVFRSNIQSDNILLRETRENGPYTYGVFDGLGGGDQGEVASLIAAEMLSEFDADGIYGRMDEYVESTHKRIADHARKDKLYEMGTTLTLASINGNKAQICNVGDSRIYLYRSGSLTQLSRDHTIKQSMVDSGMITAEEARLTNRGGELTQYLGIITEDDMEPEAFIIDLELEAGDVLLLCSDGLTGELDDKEICSTIMDNIERGAERTAVVLAWKAVQGACRDNVTAVVAKISRE